MKYLTEPYKHQIDGYKKLYGKEYGALFMEMGTGKSKLAIDIAVNLYLEGKINAVLIIAPNGVHRQWADEQIPIHCPIALKKMVWSSKKGRLYQNMLEEFITIPMQKIKFFCTNVDVFSSDNHLRTFVEFLLNHNVLLIVDESTRIKNPKAIRTFNICYRLCRLKKQGKRIVEVLPLSKYRLILTGTMITNSPYDLWSMFEFLKHNYFECNYYSFKTRYGIEIRDSHPGTGRQFLRNIKYSEIQSIRRYYVKGKTVDEIGWIMGTSAKNIQFIIDNPSLKVPYKHLDELKEKINQDSFIIRKEDCLDLPPKVYEQLFVEMNPEQKRIYKELKNELVSTYEEEELTVMNKVSLIGRLQQITGGFFPYTEGEKKKVFLISNFNPKLKVLKRDLEETGNEIIIIWARFVAELKLIYSELSKTFPEKRIELYYGGTYQEDRAQIIKDFKKGDVDILIANQRTAGVGLNLQKSHFHYFFSNSYSLEDRLQAEDRSHRVGQDCSVLYKDIIIKDTVDEKVHEVLKRKKDLLEYFRDNTLREFLGG